MRVQTRPLCGVLPAQGQVVLFPEKRKVGGSTPPLTTDHSEHPLAFSPAQTAGREATPWRRLRSLSPRSPQKSHNRLLRLVGPPPAPVALGHGSAAVHSLAPRCAARLAQLSAAMVVWWWRWRVGSTWGRSAAGG